MLELLAQGFLDVLQWHNLLALVAGVTVGTILGAIPGLTSLMAISLIIPFTFDLHPVTSLILLLGAYKGGIYGGSIPAILVSAPGTPAAAATTEDGYPMAKKGQARKALKGALVASVMGDMFADIVLILVAAHLAAVALLFGAGEYTVLIIFALTIIGVAAGADLTKGLVTAVLGITVSLVGIDPVTARPRLTFGMLELAGGIELVPMLIGLMAVSEVFLYAEKGSQVSGISTKHLPLPKTPDDAKFTLKDFKKCFIPIIRSSALGTFIGTIPGLGPTLGAYVGYNETKRVSKDRKEFGKGKIEGVCAAEAGNNSVSGANMIPLLGLGIPGDVLAAVIIGAFLLQGITPGPAIFREHPDVVYGVYAGLLSANIILFAIFFPLVGYFVRLAEIRTSILYPFVFIFCVIGSYGINQSLFDVWIMFIFGFIGYLCKKFGFPVSTFLIGFILGPMLERHYRRALEGSGGDHSVFFTSPVAWIFWVLIIISVIITIRQYLADKREEENASKDM